MSQLARLDPGERVAELILIVVLQTSVVILLAALLGCTVFRWRAEARHALWLAVLVLVLMSPATAAVARRSGFALWAIALPVTVRDSSPAHAEPRPSHEVARSALSRQSAKLSTGFVDGETERLHEAIVPASVEPAQFESVRVATPERYRGGSALMGGLTLFWVVGVLIGLARIALGWTRLAALFRSACALDLLRHGPTLDRVRIVLGIAALPPVVTSPKVRAPIAAGLLRPWILLPEGLAESLASDSLRDVLVHECAHVVRLDAWIGLLQRLAGMLFWPHPLVHFASGQLTRSREEVCDNYVLRCGNPPQICPHLAGLD